MYWTQSWPIDQGPNSQIERRKLACGPVLLWQSRTESGAAGLAAEKATSATLQRNSLVEHQLQLARLGLLLLPPLKLQKTHLRAIGTLPCEKVTVVVQSKAYFSRT